MSTPRTYHDYIKQYFQPSDWQIAEAIVLAESGGNTNATNHNNNNSTDYGLFQVNSVHRDKVTTLTSLFDPETNVRVASQIKNSSGWHAWATFNSGKYRRFL